jgi:hypothetical protein
MRRRPGEPRLHPQAGFIRSSGTNDSRQTTWEQNMPPQWETLPGCATTSRLQRLAPGRRETGMLDPTKNGRLISSPR